MRLLILLAALAVVVAGCGDGDGDEGTGTSDTVAPDAGGAGSELTVAVDGGEFDQLRYTITCGSGDPRIEPAVEGLDADAACDRLGDEAVVRRLVDGAPADQVCTEVYGGPQVATLIGTLAGQPVEAAVTRTNGCEISTWDELLAGVLPATQGALSEE